MPIMRRIVAGLCLAILAALGAGCSTPGARPEAGPPGAATWTNYAADVISVTPGPGARTVTIAVKRPDGCSRNLSVTNVSEERGYIYAGVGIDLFRSVSAPPGGCPSSVPPRVTLSTDKPIGARPVVLNQKAWVLGKSGYQRCDEKLGCNPPHDHCDPVWTRAAVRGLDVSEHSQGDVEACDSRWLVMTVPDDPAACSAAGRPGCNSTTAVRRYFLSWTPAGWQTLARTSDGGCDAVLKAAPAFPRKLCSGGRPTTRLNSTGANRGGRHQ
jgi:hypothetical protein